MNMHQNARLTPCRREEMALAVISGRLSQAEAGRVYGVCAKIVARWTGRYRSGGRDAMRDRSSRPLHCPRQTDRVQALRVTELRRQRLTGAHIALETGVSPATVSRILKRAGLSRVKDIDPAEPVVRDEYKEPGGLIHLDIKRLKHRAKKWNPVFGKKRCEIRKLKHPACFNENARCFRTLRAGRPPHQRRQDRAKQQQGRGLGRAMVRHGFEDHGEGACLHRRLLTDRRHRHLPGRKGHQRHRLLARGRGLLSQPRHHRHPGDDR